MRRRIGDSTLNERSENSRHWFVDPRENVLLGNLRPGYVAALTRVQTHGAVRVCVRPRSGG